MSAFGDIWSTNGFVYESPLKDLLDSGVYSLEQLLREDELLQELKGLNPQLIAFMSTKETCEALIHYLITDWNYAKPRSSVVINGKKKLQNSRSEKKRRRRQRAEALEDVNVNNVNGGGAADTDFQSIRKTLTTTSVIHRPDLETAPMGDNTSSTSLCSINLAEEDLNNSTLLSNTGSSNHHPEEDTDDETYDEDELFEELSPVERTIRSIRYPYMACEVICCEINDIIDTLVDNYVLDENEEFIPYVPSKDYDSCASNDGSREEDVSASNVTSVTFSDENSKKNGANNENKGSSKRERATMLDLLFSILDQEPGTLDDCLGGYFEKVLMVLFRLRASTLGTYINSSGLPLLKKLMDHLYNNSIMQVLLKLLMPLPTSLNGTDDDEQGWNSNPNSAEIMDGDANGGFMYEADIQRALKCEWYNEPSTLPLLLSNLIAPNNSEDDNVWLASHHASQILSCLIQHSPLHSNFMMEITSGEILCSIVDRATNLIDGEDFVPYECPMTYCMNVLEIILLQLAGYGNLPLNPNEGSYDADFNNDDIANIETLLALLPTLLSNLESFLHHPNTLEWKALSSQTASKAGQAKLGASRLRIIKLVEAMVLTNHEEIDDELRISGILKSCFNLFLEMEYCSMLHQSVANIVVLIMEGGDQRSDLQKYFIEECFILQRFVTVFDKCIYNEDVTPQEDGTILYRPGYMGHIIVICQAIELVYSSSKLQLKQEELRRQQQKFLEQCNSMKNEDDEGGEEGYVVNQGILDDEDNHEFQHQQAMPLSNDLVTMIEEHEFYSEWSTFISTTLSQAVSIQSTPLGSTPHHHNLSPGADEMHQIPLSALGRLDINETDIDVAASMMESLHIQSANEDEDEDETINSTTNARRVGEMEVDENDVNGVSNFGTTLNFNELNCIKQGEYYYDDPLGNKESTLFTKSLEDECVNDEDDDKEDSAVPVMDLFVTPEAQTNLRTTSAGDVHESTSHNENTKINEFFFDADFSAFESSSHTNQQDFEVVTNAVTVNTKTSLGSNAPASSDVVDPFLDSKRVTNIDDIFACD